MFETIISYNGDTETATVIVKGNNQLFDHLEQLIIAHPDKVTRIQDGYTIPRLWVRITPIIKK